MSNPIPSLPPLSSIQDPAVKAYLQALTNAWLVRNGQLGDGSEKFLTAADLKGGVALIASNSGNAWNTSNTYSIGAQQVADALSGNGKFVELTPEKSKTWAELQKRLDRVESPEWFQGKFGSAIKTEQTTRESALEDVANQTTTAITNLAGNIAIAQQQLEAASTEFGASAQAITNLQTTVGDVTTTAQQAFSIAQDASGKVDGAWSIKFDANGYVAGFGFGISGNGGNYTSDFVVLANKFSIAHPGGKTSPFYVEGGTTYIQNAVIKNASITGVQVSAGVAAADVGSNTNTVAVGTSEVELCSAQTVGYSVASGETTPEVVGVASFILANTSGALRTYTAHIREGSGGPNCAQITFTVATGATLPVSFVAKLPHRTSSKTWYLSVSSNSALAGQDASQSALYVSRLKKSA